MIRGLGFQMLAHTEEVELFPKGKTVMGKHQGEEAFSDKGLVLTLTMSFLFFMSLADSDHWFHLILCLLGPWDGK